MRLEDFIDELFNGKKLRRSSWLSHQYIHMSKGQVVWQDGLSVSLWWFLQQGDTDWGFYDEARMDIPDAFWEMSDPEWNYLAMNADGLWFMYDTRPKDGAESWFDAGSTSVRLECFTWYKKQGDWAKTLYKRPGAE